MRQRARSLQSAVDAADCDVARKHRVNEATDVVVGEPRVVVRRAEHRGAVGLGDATDPIDLKAGRFAIG